MAFGNVRLRLRPLRFAFLVDPSDRSGLRDAIELNSALWGGMFNPIIPAYQRLPPNWGKMLAKRETARVIISGYLDAFDPDIVVPVGVCAGRKIDVGNRRIITPAHILEEFDDEWSANVGIGLAEVLSYFKYKELRFQRRKPLSIIRPKFDGRYQLFLASIFGELPEDVGEIVFDNVLKGVDVEDVPCTLGSYFEILRPENLFVRRLGALYLEQRLSDPALFFMDATKPLDIMDYWNLRAAGKYVVPVPRQGANEENLKDFCKKFIESNHQRNYSPPFHQQTCTNRSLTS